MQVSAKPPRLNQDQHIDENWDDTAQFSAQNTEDSCNDSWDSPPTPITN